MLRIYSGIVLLALACGCGETIQRDEAIALDQLPAGLLKTAQEKLPEVTFEMAYKVKFNGQDAYEVRGKSKDGKIREVELSPTGDILEVE